MHRTPVTGRDATVRCPNSRADVEALKATGVSVYLSPADAGRFVRHAA